MNNSAKKFIFSPLVKKICYIIFYSICGIIIYIVSYGVVLPVMEATEYYDIAYVVYEPVEFLRFKNTAVWRVTEKIYRECHGQKFSLDRFYFQTPRKNLTYFENGIKKTELIQKDGLVYKWHYYSNGNPQMYSCDDAPDGIFSTSYFENGAIQQLSAEGTLLYPNGRKISVYIDSDFDMEGNRKLFMKNSENGERIPKEQYENCQININGRNEQEVCFELMKIGMSIRQKR